MYEPLAYNYTEFSVPMERGVYAFARHNRATTGSEAWIHRGSAEIYHHQFVADGFSRVEIPANDTYTVSVNGQGVIAFVDIGVVDAMVSGHNPVEVGFGPRFGTVIGSTADKTVCLQSDAAGSWTLWDRRFSQATPLDLKNATNVPLEGTDQQYLFFQAEGPVGGTLTVFDVGASGDCRREDTQGSGPTAGTPGPPGTPGLGPWLLLVAGWLAALAHRGPRRFSAPTTATGAARAQGPF